MAGATTQAGKPPQPSSGQQPLDPQSEAVYKAADISSSQRDLLKEIHLEAIEQAAAQVTGSPDWQKSADMLQQHGVIDRLNLELASMRDAVVTGRPYDTGGVDYTGTSIEGLTAPLLEVARRINQERGFEMADSQKETIPVERHAGNIEEPASVLSTGAAVPQMDRQALTRKFQVRFRGNAATFDQIFEDNLDVVEGSLQRDGFAALVAAHHSGKSVHAFQLAERYGNEGGMSCMVLGAMVNEALFNDIPAAQGERNGIEFSSARELKDFIAATVSLKEAGAPVRALLVIDEAGVVTAAPEAQALLKRFVASGGHVLMIGHDPGTSPHVIEHLGTWAHACKPNGEGSVEYDALHLALLKSGADGKFSPKPAEVWRHGSGSVRLGSADTLAPNEKMTLG